MLNIFKILLILAVSSAYGQTDSISTRLNFEGDFRFRLEGDWDSRKADGTFRSDRFRMRYRLRFGFTYQVAEWGVFGARIRTGAARKQQDSQLTLGDGFKEFAAIPVGFDRLYFKLSKSDWTLWLGKKDYPFKKNGELFWSDNVNPEGVFAQKDFTIENTFFNSVGLRMGHFVIATNGSSLDRDASMSGLQLTTRFLDDRLTLNPAWLYFRNIPNMPDGFGTFDLDYSIVHLNSKLKIWKKKKLNLEVDVYKNLIDYGSNDSISPNLSNQTLGYSIGLCFGRLKNKKNLYFMASYMRMQRWAAVDFLAQNDWVRWDYSGIGSPDGRLTNYQGMELVAGYMLTDRISLKLKYYVVEQLVPYGDATETGKRLRLDLDVRF